MDQRTEELSELKSYRQDIDKDLTMILQSLQWDRTHILKHPTMVTCKIDANHKMPPEKAEEHERECLLRDNGYKKEDQLLPDPLDPDASTLIKFKKEDITQIIDNAAKSDPTFQRGVGSGDLEPQSLDRLQSTYTTDERRAIHDAVVSAAPSCHDLTDVALTSVSEDTKTVAPKSRVEILAELRDMRRRRTKYRVAAKTKNYSDTLRDVIKTQMELYNEALGDSQEEVIEVDTDSNKTEELTDNKKSKDDKNKSERKKESNRRGDSRERSRRQRDRRDSKYDERRERERDRKNRDSPRKRSSDRKRRDRSRSRDRRRDTSRDRKRRDDSKTRYDRYERDSDRRDRDRLRKDRPADTHDRHLYPGGSQERHKEERKDRKEKQKKPKRFIKIDNRDTLISDEERARNLIIEIKRDIKPNKDEHKNSDCTFTGTIEINQEKRYRDYISRSGSYQRPANRAKDDSNDKNDKDKREREEVKLKTLKYYRPRDRERSAEKVVKRSRTEYKHKIYSDIYSELEKLRSQASDDD